MLRTKLVLDTDLAIELNFKYFESKKKPSEIILENLESGDLYTQVCWNSETISYEEIPMEVYTDDEDKKKTFEYLDQYEDHYREKFPKERMRFINMVARSGQVPFASFNFTNSKFEFNNFELRPIGEEFIASFKPSTQYVTENILIQQYKYESKLKDLIKYELRNSLGNDDFKIPK